MHFLFTNMKRTADHAVLPDESDVTDHLACGQSCEGETIISPGPLHQQGTRDWVCDDT